MPLVTTKEMLKAALAGHFAAVPDFVMFAGWSALGLTQYSIIKLVATRYRIHLLRRRSHAVM